ncbi:MAG: glutamine--fructose-6-phosphate aminotransferase [Devosia sp. 67-54]|uniref:glutamine--fructose-6-phosphate transaminase (isomerizing) n=1 Tax=unclassified Devosia TaxID=196773 RepID=UPI00086C8516|nr:MULTISPECIES: glutamine--fructose-6-phosphate transaminase (isomerizing) [unclassified Devosia]MBN9304195.1 glutamine--fructose-6-phosphate transaminase (isomerizing) [Devosia sp.]ODU62407.1 MAG: glutamine--fructose-6-phosphate aminotransferase [Pelagibacterium sp. SCN 68-10]OJX18014.1 MAG: glutamine--fructose-6-phosphate aminotransferase [Devosia sp. 67-54]
MCGIVGIIGVEPVAPRLVDALKRLEYRGYDSAGVATLEHGSIARRRAEGKLGNLQSKLGMEPLAGNIGIGHTRWATHGAPTETNAHPHATDKVAVVHNGIIENFRELLEDLAKDGYLPRTQTDTESVALWVTREIDRGLDPEMAVARTLKQLRGAFALAFMFKGHEHLLIAARHGAPLAVGYGETEMYLGSDAMALAPFTSRLSYLLDGDWAVITPRGVTIRDGADAIVRRETLVSQASALLVDKGNHRHFMAKEIYEQPETISHTLSHYVDMGAERVALREALPFDFKTLSRLTISACGTAYYAGLIAKYWFERYARLPVEVDVASEFRYREPPVEPGSAALFISQSGETADTLAALRYCAKAGQHVVSLLNVPDSTIGRESEMVFPTLCGPEIGVASTKALTAQLTALASLVVAAGVARGTIDRAQEREMVRALVELPAAVSAALGTEAQVEKIAKGLSKAKDVLYLGRGQMFPVAMEGALKLKEISYIHAEGYPAGELKHGPIALVDEVMPVIVVAPSDDLQEKTLSNMQEVAARGGQIILVTDADGQARIGQGVAETIVIPKVASFVAPILALIPVQLLAYHTAVFMGTDVDQPRNLAKSVTVE